MDVQCAFYGSATTGIINLRADTGMFQFVHKVMIGSNAYAVGDRNHTHTHTTQIGCKRHIANVAALTQIPTFRLWANASLTATAAHNIKPPALRRVLILASDDWPAIA